uniref:Lung adenoma susceptibility protein 2 n=1 Tax=Aquila chrysaetos chrysaetos TaxID=223781 RepID=A0A663EPV1_AQUCH
MITAFGTRLSVCSPDSTVSSLLTSYSTDSNNPCSNSLIHYKDKLYSSASEALEAYIEDFDLSLTSSEIRTGKIYQLEPLTSKADRGLGNSTENLSNNLENDGSPSTTDILEAERSWENAPGNALPFPKADIIHKFLEDCLNDKNKENTFSGGHHQRPLEALKLMLFKLQEIQASLNQNKTAEQKEEFEKVSSQNLMKFSRGRCKALHLVRKKHLQQYCLARELLCCKYPRGLGRYKLNMSHLCALAAKEGQ